MSAAEIAELRERVDACARVIASAFKAEGLPVPPDLGVIRPRGRRPAAAQARAAGGTAGPDHYAAAERLLDQAGDIEDWQGPALLAIGHALLAVADSCAAASPLPGADGSPA
jgi:hypothetical protein